MEYKKTILILLIVFLFLLFGCSGNNPVCGNGVCEFSEDNSSSSYYCPTDCGLTAPVCGDGVCESDENSGSCPLDCANPSLDLVQILINPEKSNFNVGETINLLGVSQNSFMNKNESKNVKASFLGGGESNNLTFENNISSSAESNLLQSINELGPQVSNKSIQIFESGGKKYLLQENSKVPIILESNNNYLDVVQNEYIVELKSNSLSAVQAPLLSELSSLKTQLDSIKKQASSSGTIAGTYIAASINQTQNLISLKEKEIISIIESQKRILALEHSNFNNLIYQVIGSKYVEKIVVIEEYKNVFNGFSIRATPQQISEIKLNSNVKQVYPNKIVRTNLMDSTKMINADDVWLMNDSNQNSVTGKGISIAIIDTGIDYTHSDLGATKLPEREFTQINQDKIELNLNSPYAYSGDNLFSMRDRKIAYFSDSNIFIYDFDSESLVSYESFELEKVLQIYFDGEGVLYFTELGNLFYLNLQNPQTKLIKSNIEYIKGLSVTSGRAVFAAKLSDEKEYVYSQDIISGDEIKIPSTTDFISNISTSNGKIAYSEFSLNGTCFDKLLIIDAVSGQKIDEINDNNVGGGFSFEGNKLLYFACEKDDYYTLEKGIYYLYDLVTKQKKELQFPVESQNNTSSVSSAQEKLAGYISWISKGVIDGDLIYFSKNIGESGRIKAYDSELNRYVTINLLFDVGAIDAQNGKICMMNSGNNILCHDYNRYYSYPEVDPTKIFNNKVVGGYDFVNGDSDPIDDHGHGTHCASIAAGNGVLKGVAPDAKLYAFKVLNSDGDGSWASVIAGINRAMDPNNDGNFSDHVDVISLSLGGEGNPDDPVSKAVDAAVDAGVVVAVAAGNNGYPQSIGSPGTSRKAITVGAIDKSGNLAYFSSAGPVIFVNDKNETEIMIKPDVTAPGVSICAAQYDSAWEENKCLDDAHTAISGTSMATPHVAGAAALVKQLNPTWVPEKIKSALKGAYKITNSNLLNPTKQGTGLIDIKQAILIEDPLIVELSTSGALKENARIIGTVKGDNLLNYTLSYGKLVSAFESYPLSWTVITSGNSQVINNQLILFDTTLVEDGKYLLKLSGTDRNGNVFDAFSIIKISNDSRLLSFTGSGGSFNGVVTGDITGDGIEEVIGAESIDYTDNTLNEPKIWVWDKNGNVLPSWPKQVDYWSFYGGSKYIVAPPVLADIDADGLNEIIIASGSTIYAFNYDGTYVQNFPVDITTFEAPGAIHLHDRISGLSVDDLDADGQFEIVFLFDEVSVPKGQKRQNGVVYIVSSQGTLRAKAVVGGIVNRSPSIGDVDEDGKKEISVSSLDCSEDGGSCGVSIGNKIVLLDWNGKSKNGWPIVDHNYSWLFDAPLIGDIDYDGNKELTVAVAHFDGSRWDILSYSGDGKIKLTNLFVSGMAWDTPVIILTDFDNDSYPEIIANDGLRIKFYQKSGAKEGYFGIAGYSRRMVAADIDGDSKKELVAENEDDLEIISNDDLTSKGVYVSNQILYSGLPLVTDIDSDGRTDLILVARKGILAWMNVGVFDKNLADWSLYLGSKQRTSCYNCNKEIVSKLSYIKNNNSHSIEGTLILELQKEQASSWINDKEVFEGQITLEPNEMKDISSIWNNNPPIFDSVGNYRIVVKLVIGSIEKSAYKQINVS